MSALVSILARLFLIIYCDCNMDTSVSGAYLCASVDVFDHFFRRYQAERSRFNHQPQPTHGEEHHNIYDLEVQAGGGCRLCQYFTRCFEDSCENLQHCRERWGHDRLILFFRNLKYTRFNPAVASHYNGLEIEAVSSRRFV
jgi:hypothetical protein